MARQYAHPSGLFGRLVTAPLLNRSNRLSNEAVYRALEIQPDQRVLEVGFGGGELLLKLAIDHPDLQLTGAECSPEMRERVLRKLGNVVRRHDVRIVDGVADALPFAEGTFDCICSVNTLYFWPDITSSATELTRVLAPEGKLVLGFGSADAMEAAGYAERGFALHSPDDVIDVFAPLGLIIDCHDRVERPGRSVFHVLRLKKNAIERKSG